MGLKFFGTGSVRRIFSANRLRAFIRTPLWFGLPIAAIAGFAVVWAICGFSPAVENPLKSGMIAAGCIAFAWVLGIWASAGTPDNEAEKVCDTTAESGGETHSALRDKIVVVALMLLFLVLIAIPDICRVVEDGRPAAIGIAGFATKLLGVAAVIIPVWLRLRNR